MKLKIECNRQVGGSVRITDAFWNKRLGTFYQVTLKDTFDKLEKDGVMENYRSVIKGERHTHRGTPWHDGLLLETIRGASDYMMCGDSDPVLIERIDGYVDLIEQAQKSVGSGFLSTYTLLECPEQPFGLNGGNLRRQHDLYNHGCLFEAGVHYYKATGRTRLLGCAFRAANYLSDSLGEPPKLFIVPAHELPEYAILELYELAVDHPELAEQVDADVRPSDYLYLADFWVRGRGRHKDRPNTPRYLGEYCQDHAPVEYQSQASGHAVRATLYYTGVTRLAMCEGDETLLNSSLRLWQNATQCKMHINGGVGATHIEEKFGEDYDMPNNGYLETCACAGLIFWSESLSRATGNAQFFQVIERSLYNLMLSSVTLQGDSYFYRNPLLSDGSDHHWAWHDCPCCPPMIHKIFGMLDRMIYACDEDGFFVNLLIGSRLETEFHGFPAVLSCDTKLPWDGVYTLRAEQLQGEMKLRLRVPYWCANPTFALNVAPVSPEIENGYAIFDVRQGDVVSIMDDMPVVRVEAHPYVQYDRGQVAIMRGPIVYCLEGVDNHGFSDIELAEDPEFECVECPDLLDGIVVITGKAADGTKFTAVPLNVWDNRLAGQMRVWLRQDGKRDGWEIKGWENKLYRPYLSKRSCSR